MANSDRFNRFDDSQAYCLGRSHAAASAVVPPGDAVTGSSGAPENGLTWTQEMAGAGGFQVIIHAGGPEDRDLSFNITPSLIEVFPATDNAGDITTTSAQALAAFPTDHGFLCQHTVGSLGTGLLTAETATSSRGSNPFENGTTRADAYAAGVASWSANPSGHGRDECDRAYGGGFGG